MHDEVISDTTPLQYLHQVDCLDLLPQLYGRITVPEAVAEELAVGHARRVSLPVLKQLDWIQIRTAPHREVLPLAIDLGEGEREVLSLAAGRPNVLVLLDDNQARHFAKHLGLSFTGTLGILLKAKSTGKLKSIKPVLDQLQSLGFWLDSSTRAAILELAGES